MPEMKFVYIFPGKKTMRQTCWWRKL